VRVTRIVYEMDKEIERIEEKMEKGEKEVAN
jgi:hypothetical protein